MSPYVLTDGMSIVMDEPSITMHELKRACDTYCSVQAMCPLLPARTSKFGSITPFALGSQAAQRDIQSSNMTQSEEASVWVYCGVVWRGTAGAALYT